MLVASNFIINPEMAPWLVVKSFSKPLCRINDHPAPSKYPELVIWDSVDPINALSIQHLHRPWIGTVLCCKLFLQTLYRIYDQKWFEMQFVIRDAVIERTRTNRSYTLSTELKVLLCFFKWFLYIFEKWLHYLASMLTFNIRVALRSSCFICIRFGNLRS